MSGRVALLRSATGGGGRVPGLPRWLHGVVVAGVAVAALSAMAAPAKTEAKPPPEIESVRLSAEKLPAGWTLAREVEAEPEQYPPFERKLGVKTRITGLATQLFESEAGKVQVNYVSFLIPDEMALAYRVMHQLARGAVTVLARDRVTIEIGATSEELKALATSWFEVSTLQTLKVKQHQVSTQWHLYDEVLLTEAARKRFVEEHGVELAEGLSQFFRMESGEVIRVDLYQPVDSALSARLHGALLRKSDLRSKLVALQGCVVEISTNDTRGRDRAMGLLEANAEKIGEGAGPPKDKTVADP